MALADLLTALETEASAEASRLRDERRAAAAAVITDARRQATDLVAAAVDAAGREEQRAGALRLRASRDALAARMREGREVAYRRIAERVRAELAAVRERADYPAILAALLAEARAVAPATGTVRVCPADEPLVRRWLADEPDVRIEATLDSAGGVEISDGAGTRVRNTVEDRFTTAEPALRALVGELLECAGAETALTPTTILELPA
jgi:vacuolar-type H+-ATPase subunit E/Vma4